MSFEMKRIHIEFTGKNRCVITNFLKQKKFFLNDECIVNLITFEKQNEPYAFGSFPSSFFVNFFPDNETDSYVGEVLALIGKDEVDAIGVVDLENNSQTFEVSVWVEN